MGIQTLPATPRPPAVSAAEMARADRVAIQQIGIPEVALMENAASRIAEAARIVLGGASGKRVVAIAGRGNNGGDALAAARHLLGWGADARGALAPPRQALRPLAELQARALEGAGASLQPLDALALAGADLLLDGLLGYGASGAPRGDVARAIALAAAAGVPVLAVDLPSGLDPDGGGAAGAVLDATWTVTLALPKTGLLAPQARTHVGVLLLADIGIPARAYLPRAVDTAAIFAAGTLVRVLGA